MRIFHGPEDNASRVYLIACPGAIIKSRSYLISSFCVRKSKTKRTKGWICAWRLSLPTLLRIVNNKCLEYASYTKIKRKNILLWKCFYENLCKPCYLNCQRNAFSILQNWNHNISTWMIISSCNKETKSFGNYLSRPHWVQSI